MAQAQTENDWTTCELIEQVPGKVSGRPIVRGTHIMPDPSSTVRILATASMKSISHAFR